MALKLILGNSGSGKTEYIYEQVVKLAEANPRKNYLCLVPEQYTMHHRSRYRSPSHHHRKSTANA